MFVSPCRRLQFGSARVGVVVLFVVLGNSGVGTSDCGSAAAALQM